VFAQYWAYYYTAHCANDSRVHGIPVWETRSRHYDWHELLRWGPTRGMFVLILSYIFIFQLTYWTRSRSRSHRCFGIFNNLSVSYLRVSLLVISCSLLPQYPHHRPARNSLIFVVVPLRNYSLTQPCGLIISPCGFVMIILNIDVLASRPRVEYYSDSFAIKLFTQLIMVKAGMVHSVSGWTQGVQVKLWDPLRTRAIPERLRGAFTTRRYTNPRLPYLTLFQSHVRLDCWVTQQTSLSVSRQQTTYSL